MACPVMIELNNGEKMPSLGFGTWEVKDKECETAIEEALQAGYRHIDTAFVYGNEHILGKVINKWMSSGKVKREDLFITTKLLPIGLQPERVEDLLKESLKNLGLDYVDLYLIHFPVGLDRDIFFKEGKMVADPTSDFVACWKKLEEQVEGGRTKGIGVSNSNISQIQRILDVATIRPANLQVELHAYMQQEELVDFCKDNGISVIAYSPLGNPGYNNFLIAIGMEKKELPNIMGNSTVKLIAEKHGKSPAQVLLRHGLDKGIAVIPKSVNPVRIKENIDVFDFSLDEEDTKALNELAIGPSARVCDFKFVQGFMDHPEYPF